MLTQSQIKSCHDFFCIYSNNEERGDSEGSYEDDEMYFPSDEDNFGDDGDSFYDDEDDVKSKMSNYSMTSSVIRRTEG